jgi:anaerobic selenocysteine-containing dehydrogenase
MIDCLPEAIPGEIERLAAELAVPVAADALLLIGRRHIRSNNSWMHNSHRLVKGPRRDQLLMHPQDLAARGLHDGQRVTVSSRTGSVGIEVQATPTIMPGTVSLPHGWGHDRDGVRLGIAAQHAGVSANDLTDERFIDRASGNAALNGVPVTVCAAGD